MKLRTVAIHTVAHIPVRVLADALEQAGVVAPGAGDVEEHLDRRGEELPVVFASLDGTGGLEGGDDVLLHAGVELLPEFVRGAEHGLREKRGVDERLAALGEIQEVGRFWVGAGVDGGAGEGGDPAALCALRRGVRAEFKPGSQAAEKAAE
ncbi:MAG: hypothetical protein NTV51_00630, partial [Verrucomicrobia bacterium]|nr:hypothetical protein [Verrucomicrobiota bacterium]